MKILEGSKVSLRLTIQVIWSKWEPFKVGERLVVNAHYLLSEWVRMRGFFLYWLRLLKVWFGWWFLDRFQGASFRLWFWQNETPFDLPVGDCLKDSWCVVVFWGRWFFEVNFAERVIGVGIFGFFNFLLQSLVFFVDLVFAFEGESIASRYVG